MRPFGTVATLAAVMLALPAAGEEPLSYAQYQDQTYHDSTLVKHYIEGLLAGFDLANSRLAAKSQPTLYCKPALLPIDAETAQKMMDTYIDDNRRTVVIKGYFKIDTSLLAALINAFPCPGAAAK